VFILTGWANSLPNLSFIATKAATTDSEEVSLDKKIRQRFYSAHHLHQRR
jgi:hypothetical protein